ncbi:DMT family transporter [Anabaena sp. UHCC 0187]|uniref:DMT family transporter n=1 Tax=Anabaena sp. UHCC 0187 TaxID=2590018 RepID=UPI001447557D|nr:DMT family transporter [Anabaena sp. UHCC 0187]MTJ12581.1 DMT family transporter [Anabaena sp. UHCC 0187]
MIKSQLADETAGENEKSRKRLAIASLVFSLIAFAFVPLLIRWCEEEISPEATMFNRLWIAALIIVCGQGLRKIKQILTNQQPAENIINQESVAIAPTLDYQLLLLWIITVTAFATGPILWAWSLQQTSIANSALMHNLTPLFTTVIGWLLFKTQFNRRFILGTVIAVGGTVALCINDFQLDISKIPGDALALASAMSWGVSLLCMERLRDKFSSSFIQLWLCIVGMVLTMLVTLALGEQLFPSSLPGWLAVVSLAIVGQLLGQGLITYSLSYFSASFVALVFLLDPVLTAITAWFAFGETLNLANAIAFAIILFGVYCGITASQTKTDPDTQSELSLN